ncbi:MAG: acetate--CoA ligase [Bdellovibrionota bacterium]
MGQEIESILHEQRTFVPSAVFSKQAHVKSLAAYKRQYERAAAEPEKYWAQIGRALHWYQKWNHVLDWQPPFAKWYVGGKLNLSHNCLDRHLKDKGDRLALVWEGEPGDFRRFTFRELHTEVCKFANVLKKQGIQVGDRVAIYMPMIPEAAIAMLACARIGATHSVIFGGFSATAVRDRVLDAGAKAIVTADGGWRRGKIVPLKPAVDAALSECPGVEKVVVVRRCRNEIAMKDGRDSWWHQEMEGASPECFPEHLDSNHPLFILYTSGTTGKPKGIYHSTGGYLAYATATAKNIFDLKADDIHWCTADIGWVTGHSYVLYGILSNGVATMMYEGAPDYPDPARLWKMVERHRPTIFYTAPTAIRAFIKWGAEHVRGRDLSSLRLLGTVGEPINPEAWIWYHRTVGQGRCPIVDTWWQTETGAALIAPLPGAIPTKPGSATLPFFGIEPEIVDETGAPCPPGKGGYLVIKKPWPGLMLGIWRDGERYKQTYWERFSGKYFAGDGAHVDKDGYFWIMGRIDDVVNVAGHRLGTMEVESACVSHPAVAEAAVVGRPDSLKGQALVTFVSLRPGQMPGKDLAESIKAHVSKEIGAIARPDDVRFTQALPKTRSGKIMRRLLRDIASGAETQGDVTTLEDFSVVEKLRQQAGQEE